MNENTLKDIIKEVVAQLEIENGKMAARPSALPTVESACGSGCSKDNRCINSHGCGKSDCNCTGESLDDVDEDEITAPGYRERLLVPTSKDEKAYRYMKGTTPARIGVWRAGDRPLTETVIRFRADHALAIDSVFSAVDENFIEEMGWTALKTQVEDKDEHITRPDLGRDLCKESKNLLMEKCKKNPTLQIIISDGLSSKAVEANMRNLLPAFMQGLKLQGIDVGTPVFVKYGRVAVMDAIGEDLNAEAAIIFVGERPGLITAESLSAYMIYKPRRGVAEAERTVLSNIHAGGTPPVEAGAHLATLMKKIIDTKASGVHMEK